VGDVVVFRSLNGRDHKISDNQKKKKKGKTNK
jgi:hypothetical protein